MEWQCILQLIRLIRFVKSQLMFVATLLPMCLPGGSLRLKLGSKLHCEIVNMPPKRCRHGKAAAKAKAVAKAVAKAAAKAVAKAKMVAKAQAKAKARARFGRANSRRQHRRRALAELNVLAGECGLFAAQVVVKVAVPAEVERLVRLLEARCDGPSGLGRRRLANWRCACSRLRAGSMRSTMCAVYAWVCLTGSACLVRPLGTGCPSECGSFVELRQTNAAVVDAAATTPHHMERGDSLGDSLGIPGGLARILGGLALKRGCFPWV